MSEAMTNPEIEDVLASIRRLVAQDRRPRPERLILTEEFRVRQANIAAPPRPEAPPRADATGAPVALARVVADVVRAQPETVVTEPQALVAPAPDVPDVPASGLLIPPTSDLAPEALSGAAAVPGHDTLTASAPGIVPGTAPDMSADLPDPGSAAAAVAAPQSTSLEADLRDLEARFPPPPSPPQPGHQQQSVRPEAPATAKGEIVPDDVTFIDEDDLQRLVARIVREELRGQLGERITQQVRKLVRAEIARALDERNLLG
jgi:hypothetical protein